MTAAIIAVQESSVPVGIVHLDHSQIAWDSFRVELTPDVSFSDGSQFCGGELVSIGSTNIGLGSPFAMRIRIVIMRIVEQMHGAILIIVCPSENKPQESV